MFLRKYGFTSKYSHKKFNGLRLRDWASDYTWSYWMRILRHPGQMWMGSNFHYSHRRQCLLSWLNSKRLQIPSKFPNCKIIWFSWIPLQFDCFFIRFEKRMLIWTYIQTNNQKSNPLLRFHIFLVEKLASAL